MNTTRFATTSITGREWKEMEYGTLLAINLNTIPDKKDLFLNKFRFEKIAKSGLVVVFLDGDTRKKFTIPRLELDRIIGE